MVSILCGEVDQTIAEKGEVYAHVSRVGQGAGALPGSDRAKCCSLPPGKRCAMLPGMAKRPGNMERHPPTHLLCGTTAEQRRSTQQGRYINHTSGQPAEQRTGLPPHHTWMVVIGVSLVSKQAPGCFAWPAGVDRAAQASLRQPFRSDRAAESKITFKAFLPY